MFRFWHCFGFRYSNLEFQTFMEEKSFGIIPIWKEGRKYQVLLIRSKKYGHWGWPKGRGEIGEDAVTAARREFEEETGSTDYFLIRDLQLTNSWEYEQDNKKIAKTVVYFIGFVRNQKVKPQAEEVADYKWVNVETAIAELSFPDQRKILADAKKYLQGIKIDIPS